MMNKEVPHVTVIIDGQERRVPEHLVGKRAFKIHGARVVRDAVAPTKITPPPVISEDDVTEEDQQTETPKRGRPRKPEA